MSARILRADGAIVPLLWSINAAVFILTMLIIVIMFCISVSGYGFYPAVALLTVLFICMSTMLGIVFTIIYIQVKILKANLLGKERLQSVDEDLYLKPRSNVHGSPPNPLPAEGTQARIADDCEYDDPYELQGAPKKG